MRKRVLLVATAAAFGAAAPASAADLTITTQGRSFSPARATVVSGDTVHWRNTDAATHNVTSPDFRSGNLAPGAAFSQRLDRPGSYPYVCTLHSFMSGQVEVVAALLEGPAGDVLSGSAFELTGRVAADSGTVTLERVGGAGAEPVATAQPAPDGTFKASLVATETASYRAVAGAATSAPIEVRVVSKLRIGLAVHRGRRFDHILVRTRPAPRGEYIAVLQLYSRERFSWRRAGHRKLDASGRTRFRVSSSLRRRARVVLLSADGAEVAVSPSVRVWRSGGVRPFKPSRPGGGNHGGSGGRGDDHGAQH